MNTIQLIASSPPVAGVYWMCNLLLTRSTRYRLPSRIATLYTRSWAKTSYYDIFCDSQIASSPPFAGKSSYAIHYILDPVASRDTTFIQDHRARTSYYDISFIDSPIASSPPFAGKSFYAIIPLPVDPAASHGSN